MSGASAIATAGPSLRSASLHFTQVDKRIGSCELAHFRKGMHGFKRPYFPTQRSASWRSAKARIATIFPSRTV
jgi:hypothetical protein